MGVTGPEDSAALRVLNRSICWTQRGIIYESDRRRVEKLGEELQLSKKLKWSHRLCAVRGRTQ